MNERNFSRRRNRGGMRFRPQKGLTPNPNRPDREAVEARAEVVGGQAPTDKLFDRARHAQEIERAENIAAGLPPEGASEAAAGNRPAPADKGGFREPNMQTPAEVQEEKPYEPVAIAQRPQGIVESIRMAASNVLKKVQRLIKPVKRTHKEVIINAESLETRVAVLEEGKLEEFTIERTTEERLVGSIFKGKVRNLEDGLKAAFVDIGFEKNAFLHYWDIVPSNFDSGVELV